MEEFVDLNFDIWLIGVSGVGCNSIKNSFVYDRSFLFLEYLNMSPLNYNQKLIHKNNLKIILRIWSGYNQKRFWSLNLSFLERMAQIVILVYDNNDEGSIDSIIYRYNCIKDISNKIFCVCRNKIDLENRISLTGENKIQQFLLENKIDLHFKISCKTFEGIEEMFDKIIDSYLKKYNINENTIEEYKKNEINKNNKNENNKCIII